MINKLFNDKRFIFIFAFLIEFVFYYFFEYQFLGGEYILPDIGLAPILGLIFGPVGALGQALATLVFEIYEGLDLMGSLIDTGIMFFISILTYKLWYNIFKKREINTPKLDSLYNLLKFSIIILIVSIVYWTIINISLEAYPPLSVIYPIPSQYNGLSYFFNIFDFSIIFGLLFISIFNIVGIPMRMPKIWPNIFNIKYKYFISIFFILLCYLISSLVLNLQNKALDKYFFLMSAVFAVLFCLNKFKTSIKRKKTNYSIIEGIILAFLILLAFTFSLTFPHFEYLTLMYFGKLNQALLMIIALTIVTTTILLLSIIFIYFIEKEFSNPIYDLIEALRNYDANEEVNSKIKNRLLGYLKKNDEISKLVESFLSLNTNIFSSLNQIEETTAQNQRIETELNVASKIQRDMLKTDFNDFSKDRPFEIYGYMNPAREVGGDFYDYFNIGEDNIGFVIGDVSGKGVPATLFMVKTMHLIRNQNKFRADPKDVFENVNNLICQRNEGELFVTSWFGKLNLKTGKLIFVNAGHNQPLIRQDNLNKNQENDNDSFEYMNIKPNFILGGMEGLPYKQNELNLKEGDIIFLYTDGITEANSNYQGFYGEDRLKETINKYKDESLDEILHMIKNDVHDFCNDDNQFDDITMLIIRYDGCESHE